MLTVTRLLKGFTMKIFKNLRFINTAVILACLILSSKPAMAVEQIRIVTTTSVLADLAMQITGELGDIFAVASPKRDLHKVQPTPKDVLKAKKADVFIHHGAQAEPWLLPLLNAAGRQEFIQGTNIIDASIGIDLLEVPGEVSRLEGDIHPQGNPHYWLNPVNAKVVVGNITEELIVLFPEYSEVFEDNNRAFQKRLDKKIEEWEIRMRPFDGKKIVTYHRSWSYFAKAYSLNIVGEIEPKPGIPVTSRHLSELIKTIGNENVQLIITEPYQNDKPPKKISQETGVKVVELLQFNGAKKDVDDYISLMEYNISKVENALSEGPHA